jgi:SPOR domain
MRRSDPEIGAAVTRAGRGWRWAALPVVAAFALFGIVVWLAYKDISRGAPIGEPPLIRAAADPIKLPPEEVEESTVAEGGVVGRLWSDTERADQPERLLPLPEAPRSPPVVGGASQEPTRPDLPVASGAPSDGAATAPGPSADAPAPQAAEHAPSAEAEAALDRLLAEVTALSGEPPTSTGQDQTSEEPPAASPPAAAEEAAPSTTMGPPAPAESAGPSEAEAEAAASAAPDLATTETPPVRQAIAPRPPPPPPEPAPRQPSEPESAAEPTPPPAQPIQVAAIDDRYRVQVAAVREEADARRAWDLFMADLGPLLREVQPFFERAETANGVFYRVQVGRFETEEAAESLCEELKQHNASCFVIRR